MTYFKRAVVNLKRQLIKTIVLFLVLLIIGTFASFAISLSQAINLTENQLLIRTPALATLEVDTAQLLEDQRLTGERPYLEWLTQEIIEVIGSLSEVEHYDYAVVSEFFSSDLQLPSDYLLYENVRWLSQDAVKQNLLFTNDRLQGFDFQRFQVKGVYNPTILDASLGLINIEDGRMFNLEEINNNQLVAIVSQGIAEENNLSLGSTIELELRLYDTILPTGEFVGHFENGSEKLFTEKLSLEVIGIFSPTVALNDDTSNLDFQNHLELNQRIYVPMNTLKQAHSLKQNFIYQHSPEDFWLFELYDYSNILFSLHTPFELMNFREGANEILPDFWIVSDLTVEFLPLISVLQNFDAIATTIRFGGLFSSIVLLSIVTYLFVIDRRKEIGIYLALGESKTNVLKQLIVELIPLSIAALSISLFIGFSASNTFTSATLQRELIENISVAPNQDRSGRDFNSMGFGLQVTAEEMVDVFTIEFNVNIVVTFATSAIFVILLSSTIPIFYLFKLSPKEILIDHN